MALCARKEWQIAQVCRAITIVLVAGLFLYLADQAYASWLMQDEARLEKIGWLTFLSLLMVYGNLLYQSCIAGHFARIMGHRPIADEVLVAMHDRDLPSLAVLVPAYKEERDVMWQTLVSAALCDYGRKEVVLLIDDPHRPKTPEDAQALDAARDLPVSLQQRFDAPARRYAEALAAFRARHENGAVTGEAERLAALYTEAADWVAALKEEFVAGRGTLPHGDRFFASSVLEQLVAQHRATARQLRASGEALSALHAERHYRRLAHMFDVRFRSFERKKYANLSHEANKAMNLNAYLSVMGKHYVEEQRADGWHLVEATPEQASFSPPAAEYLVIIDADTILLPDYMLRLMNEMEKPKFAHIGVMQCYPSCFPGIPMGIERMAAASIDLLFRLNQGHEALGGSFWMGANSLVRRSALDDIARTAMSEGKPSTIYIQDGTVIEDTETTLALLLKGWRVFQYPERLAYFSSPPDFGSLLIQRRRWANGGILLIPMLLRYIWRAPKNLGLLRELAVRVDYLTWGPVGCLTGILMMAIHFGDLMNSSWLILLPMPSLLLQLRTLKAEGYRYSDALRLHAFGIMLGPVLMGGVLKSFQQALTGRKIPFARTPKVPSRTAAPALYAFIELMMPVLMGWLTWRYATSESWAQASFTFLSGLGALYALFFLMGLRATLEDLFVGMISPVRSWQKSLGAPVSEVRMVNTDPVLPTSETPSNWILAE
jgi:cellulose synthase/poly-beta-1,6-N-acetylglucosamine synthase-like glycosyltransferase